MNLHSLDLSDNKIRLEQLKNLRNLTELNLSYNQVSNIGDLDPMQDLKQIEYINLAYKTLKLNDLLLLSEFRKLKILDLTAN